jgi:hypothetical protein
VTTFTILISTHTGYCRGDMTPLWCIMEPEISLLSPQDPNFDHCNEPLESNLHSHNLCLCNVIIPYITTSYALRLSLLFCLLFPLLPRKQNSLQSEDFLNFYFLPNIIRVIKWRRLKLMGERREAHIHSVLVGIWKEKNLLECLGIDGRFL